MPRANIPDLPMEIRTQLVTEIVLYTNDKNRVWDYTTASAALAELVRAIILGRPAPKYASTYLIQTLKKMPDLWAKLKAYYE